MKKIVIIVILLTSLVFIIFMFLKQNDWVPISDLLSSEGKVNMYLPIGPAGMY